MYMDLQCTLNICSNSTSMQGRIREEIENMVALARNLCEFRITIYLGFPIV
jgi:hypothetical protein